MVARRHRWTWPLLMLLLSNIALAAGSWTDRVSRLRVNLVDREAVSPALAANGQAVTGHVIHNVRWKYRSPPGNAVTARLCHPGGCVPLSGQRGTTWGLSGLAADAPLRFRFALKTRQPPLTVEGLQVIVNYR